MELCIYDAGCFKPGEDLVLALGATAAAAALACAGAVLALDALDDFGKGVPGQRGFVIHMRRAGSSVLNQVWLAQPTGFPYPCIMPVEPIL